MLNDIEKIYQILLSLYPDAKCELNFSNIEQLCISVMLSAQTTDQKVNVVTPVLFKEYPDLLSLSEANPVTIEKIIHPLGLSNNKSRNLVSFATAIINDYHGRIPEDFDTLISLPGIGRKTAEVVLAEGFNHDVIAVDTHVERVSKRLGLVDKDSSTYQTEVSLNKLVPNGTKKKMHHLLIHFGRYHCKAINPKCDGCPLSKYCLYNKERSN